jgi:uncharacterized protein
VQLGRELFEDLLARRGQPVEALLALILLAPLAHEKPLALEPAQERVERSLVDLEPRLFERFPQRVPVSLGSQLREDRQREAPPPDLQPQVLEKAGTRPVRTLFHIVYATQCMRHGIVRQRILSYMEHATRLGERIKTRRLKVGMSAARLAAAAGVTENAIRKIESGDSAEPRFSTGVRLARALGVSPLILVPDIEASAEAPSLAFVIRTIRLHRQELESEGVEHIDIFGSVARGDAGVDSDVDLIVTPRSDAEFTLFNLGGIGNILESALGRTVDLVTRRGIEKSRRIAAAVAEAVRAF